MMCLIYFCFVMGQYGLTFWLPTLVKNAGVSGNFKIGLMSAIPYVVTLVAMNVVGRHSDRRRERRWHLIVPALVGAMGFAMVPLAPGVGIAIAALSLAAGGAISCAPLFWSLPTAFVSGAAAATGIAIINSVGNLAGFAAPYMIGVVTDATGQFRNRHVGDCRRAGHRIRVCMVYTCQHGQQVTPLEGTSRHGKYSVGVGIGIHGDLAWRSRYCGTVSTSSVAMWPRRRCRDSSRPVAVSRPGPPTRCRCGSRGVRRDQRGADRRPAVCTGGVAAAMAPGSVFLACATMSPDNARRLAARLAEKQLLYLDAPVSGGAARAAEGQ